MDKVNKQWRSAAAGFAVGLCVMLAINLFTGDRDRNERGIQGDAGMTENASEEINEMDDAGAEHADMESTEAENDDNMVGDGKAVNREAENSGHEEAAEEDCPVRISDNIDVSQGFIEELLLYQYIEYGLRQYNEKSNSEKQYYVDIKDMLPYDTEFCMKDENAIPFKTDLAKEMIPQLSENIYNFELIGSDENIYMSIDTYNMKIYVYDDVKK